jgi:hypothetical protein
MKKLKKALFLNAALVLMVGLSLVATGPAVAVDACSVTLTYISGSHGSISGQPSQVQVVDCGGDGTAVTAIADDCYHFVKWSDESTANPRQDINVSENITVTAVFDINTYNITYTADSNGMIVGNTSQIVNCGGNGTSVMAVPVDALSYHFDKWSDGSTDNPRTDVNVTQGIAVQAIFTPCFDITATMDESQVTAMLDGVQMSFQGCGNMTFLLEQNTITVLLDGQQILSLPITANGNNGLENVCGNFQVVMGNKTITASTGNGVYGLSVTDGCSSLILNGVPVTQSCVPINLPANLSAEDFGDCADIAAKMDGNGISATLNGEPIVESSTCSAVTFDVNADRTITANLNGQPIVLPIDVLYYSCLNMAVDLGDNQTMTANYGNGNFMLAIIDGCRSVNFVTSLPPPPPCVVAIQVLPSYTPIQVGGTQQFFAIAYYTDGSSAGVTTQASWSSSNQAVAVIDSTGLATGIGGGNTTVQATYNGIISYPSILVVVDASMLMSIPPDSLEVRPGNATIQVGDSQQFTAWANFGNFGEVDVTYLASWDIGNESVDDTSYYGEVDAAALASLALGNLSLGDLDLGSLGLGNLSLGNESIGNGSVAMVSYGVAIGLTPGTAHITATLQGVSDDAVLKVTAPPLPVETPLPEPTNSGPTILSVVVEPGSASVAVGSTQQFIATAHYSDGRTANVTSTARWDSSMASIGTVSSGLATGVAPGACAIMAIYGNVTSKPAALTVSVATATLERIVVAPGNATFSIGGTQQFTATAYYSDGSSKDVTNMVVWASSNNVVAPIDNTGLASGKAEGEAEITASLQQVTSISVPVSVVSAAVPWSIIGGIIGTALVLGLIFFAAMRRGPKREGV